jgi:hypothetical protein
MSQTIYETYSAVLDQLVDTVTEGITKEHDDQMIAAALVNELTNNLTVTRQKVIGLLVVAAVRMARALHEGDWA